MQNYMDQICGNKMKNRNNLLRLAVLKDQRMITWIYNFKTSQQKYFNLLGTLLIWGNKK